jgi:aspartate/glutamate racemase
MKNDKMKNDKMKNDKMKNDKMKNDKMKNDKMENDKMKNPAAPRDGIQGLILGGTELSLILREPTACGIPILDTTRIHVGAIVRELLT